MEDQIIQAQVEHSNALRVRAAINTQSINEADRTVDVVFGSDRPIPFYMAGERSAEILSFAPEHIRLDFLRSGGHVLDNHQRWGSVADCVLGVIKSASTDGTRGMATIQFATDETAERCWKRVKEKTLRWLSVGYKVYKYAEETDAERGTTAYRAIDWEPMEVSFVPVPADTSAGVRGADSAQDKSGDNVPVISQVTIIKNRSLMEDQVTSPPAAPATPPATPPPAAAPVVPPAQPVEGQRSAEPPTPAHPNPNASVAILQAVRAAGLDMAFAENLMREESMTADIARERCVQEWATRGAQPPINGQSGRVTRDDSRERLRADVETAVMHRVDQTVELTEGARNFAGMRIMEVYREYVRSLGGSTSGMSQREIAQSALGLSTRGASGMHSTSDFPLILGNTVNRTLRRAYELQDRSWTVFSQRTTAADFREMTAVQLGEASGFDEVKEGGEYKYGTTSEAAEKYKVLKYGKIYAFTFEMLVNDDLSAFTRMPRMIAAQAVQKQNDVVWNCLLGNSGNGLVMADNVALFNSAHNNVAASGTAITVASLAAGRAAMRKHLALDGKSFLNITPRYLVVGPDKELEAFQFTSTNYVPAKGTDINVPFITNLQVIVDPRITDNRWFLIAAPGAIDTLEYAFLEGEQELFTETNYGFETDGMQIKARMVFGAKVLEYRSFYKNAGA